MKAEDVYPGALVRVTIPGSDMWGNITCMDDDETGAYIRPRGMYGTRLYYNLSELELIQDRPDPLVYPKPRA